MSFFSFKIIENNNNNNYSNLQVIFNELSNRKWNPVQTLGKKI